MEGSQYKGKLFVFENAVYCLERVFSSMQEYNLQQPLSKTIDYSEVYNVKHKLTLSHIRRVEYSEHSLH